MTPRWKGRKMVDVSKGVRDLLDLVTVLRNEVTANNAEITRLRAAINDALDAPFSDPELNGTWHQKTIGPNETPEEAIKRLVTIRAEWAVYKNNCENPVIAELRAALATARREGMEDAAKFHDEQAARAQKLADMKVSALDAKVWGDYAENHREYAAAIRAAAPDDRPSEEIIREDRDAWPDHQANDPISVAAKEENQS